MRVSGKLAEREGFEPSIRFNPYAQRDAGGFGATGLLDLEAVGREAHNLGAGDVGGA
jgi:hypothetical protein